MLGRKQADGEEERGEDTNRIILQNTAIFELN